MASNGNENPSNAMLEEIKNDFERKFDEVQLENQQLRRDLADVNQELKGLKGVKEEVQSVRSLHKLLTAFHLNVQKREEDLGVSGATGGSNPTTQRTDGDKDDDDEEEEQKWEVGLVHPCSSASSLLMARKQLDLMKLFSMKVKINKFRLLPGQTFWIGGFQYADPSSPPCPCFDLDTGVYTFPRNMNLNIRVKCDNLHKEVKFMVCADGMVKDGKNQYDLPIGYTADMGDKKMSASINCGNHRINLKRWLEVEARDGFTIGTNYMVTNLVMEIKVTKFRDN